VATIRFLNLFNPDQMRQMRGFYSDIVVRQRPGHITQGLLTVDGKTHICALGRGGISALKREGDGATPIGAFRILSGFYRADHVSLRSAALPMTPLTNRSGWCDDVSDRNYNRFVELPYPASHETMLRKDALYDLVLVLDYNMVPRKKTCGSAIFFHVARAGYEPTEGCVALPFAVLKKMMPRLSNETMLRIIR
jgi:L,D-peptidoglycan transpeptidase YkuD (ErfK/YbiS/YcfS/YnhG family)